MKILGLGKENIRIFSKEEILKRGEERYKHNKAMFKADGYEQISNKEKYEKLRSEPLPYALFRLNELFGYTLNLIGCEITEKQYFDRLECLPPIPFKYDIYSGYIVPECITGIIYEHIFEHDNKFYCVIMEARKKEL